MNKHTRREFMADNYITTNSKKTRKSLGSRPVSAPVISELSKYISGLDSGQEKLFNDNFSYKRWRKICENAGLADYKFHDLRKTFSSLLAQNGVSTAVTQRLLEHSSPRLTNKIYTLNFLASHFKLSAGNQYSDAVTLKAATTPLFQLLLIQPQSKVLSAPSAKSRHKSY